MIIGNSPLFKEFARPVLRPDEHQHARGILSGIMDTIVQFFIDRSKIDVTRIDIADPAEDSFKISLDSRVTGTGPLPSTASAMQMDLVYGGSTFGKIDLPEFKTSFWGSSVNVRDQHIVITDSDSFQAFVRTVMMDSMASFRLENGHCTVKTQGISAQVTYQRGITIKAIACTISLVKLVREKDSDDGITAVFVMNNPSPVSLDLGICRFELRNDQGEVLAELRGHLNIVRGRVESTLHGTRKKAVAPSAKVRLVGVGVEGKETHWCSATIRHLNCELELKSKFAGLLRD